MDQREQKKFIEEVYQGVLKELPIVNWRRHPANPGAYAGWCINSWVWLYPSGDGGWFVECRMPTPHAFPNLPCLRKLHGQPRRFEDFWAALIVAVQRESHLVAHGIVDDCCERIGYATATSHGNAGPGQGPAGSPSTC